MQAQQALESSGVSPRSPGQASATPSAGGFVGRRRVVLRALGALLGLVAALTLVYLRSWPPAAIVLTGSMEPAIDAGDVVVFKGIDGGQIAVGDVVQVAVPRQVQERHKYPSEVVHRVIGFTKDGFVRTKGDAQERPDPFVASAASVHKRVAVVIPGAGKILGFLTSPFALVWLVMGALLFVALPLYEGHRERLELEQERLDAMHDIESKLDALMRTWPPGQRPGPPPRQGPPAPPRFDRELAGSGR